MRVTLIKHPGVMEWHYVHWIALFTIGKQARVRFPGMEWKKKILAARHSPIRELHFTYLIEDIPYWVSVHLCRHTHAQPYVQTQRNDRQDKYDRNTAPQNAPVSMIWSMNAEELMTIANKRLCSKASPETREVVDEICRKTIYVCPEFAEVLVPACQYNGVCHEMHPCTEKKHGPEVEKEGK